MQLVLYYPRKLNRQMWGEITQFRDMFDLGITWNYGFVHNIVICVLRQQCVSTITSVNIVLVVLLTSVRVCVYYRFQGK